VDRELEAVLAIVRRARRVVLDVYDSPFEVEMKGAGDPVTEADRRANDLLCEELARAFPGDHILAEESADLAPAALSELLSRERVFFVDPVDGTREFAAKNGEFAIMVGLAVRGAAELGVLLMPTTGEALAGRASGPGFVETETGERGPLRVSAVDAPSQAHLLVSRSHRTQKLETFTAALGLREITPCGSVGVKVARIATGRADLYVHLGRGLKLWDTCAPEAVLRSAGGAVTDTGGAPFAYDVDTASLTAGLVASNGRLHAETLAAIRHLGSR
jgi:3'(2'), 5'-bisphosphate nucleotidase